ncbi:MAG: Rieske 2Fe-2S domain-containing protein [Phormidesmis sp.]
MSENSLKKQTKEQSQGLLQNFWYAVEASPQVTSQPTQLTLMGKDYVLYRDSKGKAIALDNQCPHRGASLALGWTDGDCIRCPYHGWKFESDGGCSHIPADAPNTRIPARAKVTSYPVQERYGIVWIFVGDVTLPAAQRPSLPEFPQFDNPERPPTYSEFTFDGHYTRSIEILMDASHPPFVHKGALGKPKDASKVQVNRYTIDETEWGFTARMDVKVNRLNGINRFIFDQDDPDAYKTYAFGLPNLNHTSIKFGKLQLESLMFSVPVSDTKTIVKAVNLRGFMNNIPIVSDFLDYHVAKVGNKILAEDEVIVRQQTPQPVPYQNSRSELLVASDATMMAYRKLLRKYSQAKAFPEGLKPSNGQSSPSENHISTSV